MVGAIAARVAASAIISALNNAYDREEAWPFLQLQATAFALTAAVVVTFFSTRPLATLDYINRHKVPSRLSCHQSPDHHHFGWLAHRSERCCRCKRASLGTRL